MAERDDALRDAHLAPLSLVCRLDCGDQLVDVGVSFDDRLIIATSAADATETFAGRDDSGFASFPRSVSSRTYELAVTVVDESGDTTRRRIPGLPIAFPFVQLLPDGGLVVVGARAHFTDDGGEQNALVISHSTSSMSRHGPATTRTSPWSVCHRTGPRRSPSMRGRVVLRAPMRSRWVAMGGWRSSGDTGVCMTAW